MSVAWPSGMGSLVPAVREGGREGASERERGGGEEE